MLSAGATLRSRDDEAICGDGCRDLLIRCGSDRYHARRMISQAMPLIGADVRPDCRR
jgi:hypothetical protein